MDLFFVKNEVNTERDFADEITKNLLFFFFNRMSEGSSMIDKKGDSLQYAGNKIFTENGFYLLSAIG